MHEPIGTPNHPAKRPRKRPRQVARKVLREIEHAHVADMLEFLKPAGTPQDRRGALIGMANQQVEVVASGCHHGSLYGEGREEHAMLAVDYEINQQSRPRAATAQTEVARTDTGKADRLA